MPGVSVVYRENERVRETENIEETQAYVGVAKRAMDECCLLMIMTA